MLHIAPDDQNTQNTKPRTILWQHGLKKEFNKFQLLSRTTFISLKCCNDLFYTCNLKSSFQKKKCSNSKFSSISLDNKLL